MNECLLQGGRIIDGTGAAASVGNVRLRGDRIAEVTPARPDAADSGTATPASSHVEIIDAAGMVVCPGFIDIQSQSVIPLLTDGRSLSKITQGVTTEIMGELSTPAPFGGLREAPYLAPTASVPEDERQIARTWTRFGQWLEHLSAKPIAVNFGSFVGGGSIREYAMGLAPGRPDAQQMALMRRLTAEAMDDGAFGIAPALIYPPNTFSDEAELTELARVVASRGGTFIIHMRSEGERLLESIEENIRISRSADVPVEIYHLKACPKRNWPLMPAALERIEQARADGVDIAANMYPYTASGTGLGACLPAWAHADGKLQAHLRDPGARRRIREELLAEFAEGRSTGPDNVLVVGLRSEGLRELNGLRVRQIADRRHACWTETIMDLVQAEGPWAGAIFFLMHEDNLRRQMRRAWVKFATDAAGVAPDGDDRALPHPRAYGTFPRVLGRYVRDLGVLSLEDAVRRMTSAVADRLAISDRGVLRKGAFADVVIFDPETIADRSVYDDPHQLSIGVRDVWVNGQRVLTGGEFTGAHPGRAVYGPARRS